MFEHNHVPEKRLEAIQPCCRYNITHALILLTCCICSILYSDEVANFCASISRFLILSVAYIIGEVTLSYYQAEECKGEYKSLARVHPQVIHCAKLKRSDRACKWPTKNTSPLSFQQFPRQFGRREESRWSNRLFDEQNWRLGGLLDLLRF
jgi:hypothetical protein